jgi:hypothetical protein
MTPGEMPTSSKQRAELGLESFRDRHSILPCDSRVAIPTVRAAKSDASGVDFGNSQGSPLLALHGIGSINALAAPPVDLVVGRSGAVLVVQRTSSDLRLNRTSGVVARGTRV